MSNTKKAGRNGKHHHHEGPEVRGLAADGDPAGQQEHAAEQARDESREQERAAEQAREESRQHAMAAREKATRTKMPVGQATTMRLKRRNQPRGNR